MTRNRTIPLAAAISPALTVPSFANAAELTSAVGPIVCKQLNANAAVEINNGTTVQASGHNVAPTQAGCYNREESRGVNVTDITITKLFANEADGPSGASKNGSMSFTSTVDLPAAVTCNFNRY